MSFNDQLGSGNSRGYQSSKGAPVIPQKNNYGQPQTYGNNNYGNNSGYQSNYGNSTSKGSEYDQVVKTVSDNIRQLASNVGQIRQLSESLGTSRDSLENRENLRHLVETTKYIANDTAHTMKSLNDTRSSGPAEDRSRKTQQQKLVKDFQASLQTFQDISKFALEKERTTPLPQKPQKKQQEYYDDEQDFEKQGLIEAQKVQQLQLDNERQFMDALIADREQGIKEIERTVVEVNEIFRDLSSLVQEQGIMIDNIESNIEESAAHTSHGVEELRKANEYQKSSRTKMCVLALIILVIAAVIVLVVYFLVK